MIVIGVTGSRFWRNAGVIAERMDHFAEGHDVILIRHGKCPPRMPKSHAYVSWGEALRMEAAYGSEFLGADWLADRHARQRGWAVQEYPADWAKYGNRAGMVRNGEMVADGAHVWLGFLHPESRGTRDCLAKAERALIPAFRAYEEVLVEDEEPPPTRAGI